MSEFHQTKRGAKFFDADVPRIADALTKLSTTIQPLIEAMTRLASELDRESSAKELEHDVGEGGKPFVEQVWVIVDMYVKDPFSTMIVRASEQSARSWLTLDAEGSMAMGDVVRALASWDGQSEVVIDHWRVWTAVVEL